MVIKFSKEIFEDSEEEVIFIKKKGKGNGRFYLLIIYIVFF